MAKYKLMAPMHCQCVWQHGVGTCSQPRQLPLVLHTWRRHLPTHPRQLPLVPQTETINNVLRPVTRFPFTSSLLLISQLESSDHISLGWRSR